MTKYGEDNEAPHPACWSGVLQVPSHRQRWVDRWGWERPRPGGAPWVGKDDLWHTVQ